MADSYEEAETAARSDAADERPHPVGGSPRRQCRGERGVRHARGARRCHGDPGGARALGIRRWRRCGRKEKAQDGWGGGGGVQAAPLGFIEVKDGGAQYRRVHDPLRLAIAVLLLPLSIAAAAALMMVTLTALARSMKGMVNFPKVPKTPKAPMALCRRFG